MHGDLHDDTVLGTTTRGYELAAPVTLGLDDRRRHLHLIGKTGTGKTTLLRTLIYDDLAAGRNFAVLDPLGGLAEDVIDAVPKSRNDETIYPARGRDARPQRHSRSAAEPGAAR